ncbi:MAG: type IX secretion system membrane protein PorP/SprF [Saprospiraceae bacterium]|nr:type IX secretion system membrane protein PorP/SprF [Saprospiraceae bacterium]
MLPKILFLLLLLCATSLVAQDPFFTHFHNNESTFNPALTGIRGAFSLTSKYKSQWASVSVPAFRSGIITVEESMPCSWFDWGLSAAFDQEGHGILRTNEFGGKIAGVIPWADKKGWHNLRLGIALNTSFKRIDFSRLIFSDQLDPKLGNIFATGFEPPNSSRSLWFFNPSVGASYRWLFDEGNHKSPTLSAGVALHNAYSILKNTATGHEESLLGIGTKIPLRSTYYAALEFIPWAEHKKGAFVAANVSWLHQRQGGLSYHNVGVKASYSRVAAVGIRFHFNDAPEQGSNTHWMSFEMEASARMSKHQRVDIGMALSPAISGMRNWVGPIMEVSVAYHFGKSPSCGIANLDDDLVETGYECLTSNFTRKRKKMYEGIWYKMHNR